jgi:hypothetical protein
MNPRRHIYWLAIGVAVLVGASLAVISKPEAEAAGWHLEAVDTHWHSGVWQWTDTAYWCFGLSGWHGSGGRAADTFADASDPSCYGPSSTEVRFHVSGYLGSTSAAGAIAAPTVSQIASGPSTCDILRARLYDYRDGTLRGSYDYFHVYTNGQSPGLVYGNNQWYWNSWSIGYTVDDNSGCEWVGHHAHQTMPVQGTASGPNGALYSDGDGKVWPMWGNGWVHGWIFTTWVWY